MNDNRSKLGEFRLTDWGALDLPDAWPDRLTRKEPRALIRVAARVFRGPHSRVALPESLPGGSRIPRYVLQEFHSLPNGNYSKHVTHGYSRGFDIAMLGVMKSRRLAIARELSDCSRVLDLGCGGGHVAGILQESGIREVWGLDPSPYLLQHASRAHPGVRFVQGVAEEIDFPSDSFDGIAVSFLLHELPPKAIRRALAQCGRILQPGGRIVIVEPGRDQWELSGPRLLWRYGWRGVYFRRLAHLVYEPFLDAFHRQDLVSLLRCSGFSKVEETTDFPTNQWIAVRS
jgi:ubiquinone/menaquinone biosynthesis C-methylase UbiE